MKHVGLFAVLLFVFAAFAGPAMAEEDCTAVQDIPVNVTPVFDAPKYDYTASLHEIQRMVADTEHSIHETIALGVTHYESTLEFRTPVLTVTFPDGISCTSIQHVDVTIGYRDVTVYVAREIPQGTCGFNEIIAHEGKHIAVNRQILQEYAPRIQNRLMEYLKSNGMFRGRNRQDRDDEIALLRQSLQAILKDIGQQMINENLERQDKVDSPEEYRRLGNVCNRQLAVIAGHSLDGRR